MSDLAPLDDETFARLMAPLGPFEAAPRLAVAVSGGSDSLALALLAGRWARERGGEAVGLTVDHGLRPEAAGEAVQVAAWLAQRGIAHHTLHWVGDKPATGIQAAARTARYALLRQWCAENGVLHLLLAHHAEDQAETLLLRLARGSGVDGLSAMAAISATPEVRLLRPLLGVRRGRLAVTLEGWGQAWLEDPSNVSQRYQRVRLRSMMPSLAVEGLSAERLAATAHHLGRARQALAAATNQVLAEAVALHPAGFAWLDCAPLKEVAEDVSLRAIAQLCRTVGGASYPPRLERLQRLHGELMTGLLGKRTFAGCVLAPRGSAVLVCREPAAVDGPRAVRAGETICWDGRFTLRFGGQGSGQVSALGQAGWLAIRQDVRCVAIPSAVARTLPMLSDRHGVSAVPHLGYKRGMGPDLTVDLAAFTPAWPLSGREHCLV